MSDDLKSRLRSVGGVRHDGATRWFINPDGPEAADYIEKLEAALRQIKELHHGPENEDVSVIDSIFMRDDMTYKIVCDTLEGKDE